MKAQILDSLVIDHVCTLGTVCVAETLCVDYDHFRQLPDVIRLNGRVYGKSGWTSDRQVAFYRTDRLIAMSDRGER